MTICSHIGGSSARSRSLFRLALFACAIGAAPYYCQPLQAQTWNAPNSGSWHDCANWSSGTIPDSIDADVVINAINPPVVPPDEPLDPYSVFLDSPATVKSLLIDSPDAQLYQLGTSLTVVDGINIAQGKYRLEQSTIIGGTLQTNGNLIIANYENTLSGVHVLDQLAPTTNFSSGQLTLQNGTVLDKGINFVGSGDVTIALDQDLHLLSGSSITTNDPSTNYAYGYLDIKQNRTFTIDVGASINTNGLIIQGQGTLINYGTLSNYIPRPSINLSITNDHVINHGTIEAADGAVVTIASQSFQNAVDGKVIARDGGLVYFGGFGASWTNDGLIRIADADSQILLGGTFTGSQLATIENILGGTIGIAGTWDNSNPYSFSAQQGRIVLTNFGAIVGGELTAGPNGEFLTLQGGSLHNVQFNEDLNLPALAGVRLSGTTTIAGDINVTGGSLTLFQDFTTRADQAFVLNGTSEHTSNLTIGSGYTFTVSEPTVLNIANTNLFSETFNSGTLLNQGTINFHENNAGALHLENEGHINLVDSTSAFSNTRFINNLATGTIDIANGAVLEVGRLNNSGAVTLLGANSVLSVDRIDSESFSGIDNQAGGTIRINETWDNQSGYTFNSTTGSIHLYGSISEGSLTPGSNGEFVIFHNGGLNGVTLNGDLNLAPGSTFTLSGNTQINGNLNVGGELRLSQDLAIHDSQILTLGGIGQSHIIVSNPYDLTFEAGSVLNGSGTITTSSGSIEIGGTVSPGFSPGHIEFQSNVILDATSKLQIELASLNSFDTLDIKGNAVLAGDLNVSLLNGFALQSNQSFLFMNIAGTSSGIFNGLAENGIVGNFGGTDLFISYLGGDGNDVRLFTITAVPEPTSMGVLAACGAIYVAWRRRSRKLQSE